MRKYLYSEAEYEHFKKSHPGGRYYHTKRKFECILSLYEFPNPYVVLASKKEIHCFPCFNAYWVYIKDKEREAFDENGKKIKIFLRDFFIPLVEFIRNTDDGTYVKMK